MNRGKLLFVVAVTLALAGLAIGAFFVSGQGAGYDPDFDTSIAAPAYADQRPIVQFHEGRDTVHSIASDYRPLARMLRADGYAVQTRDGEITADALRSVTVLVIAGAGGEGAGNPAFNDAEASAISEWVLRGGALLLITDAWPLGASAAPLGERFGVEMSRATTEDAAHAEAALGAAHIVYAHADGSLADHAITRGRNANERVSRVLTYAGQSLRGPFDAVTLLTLSPQARDAPPVGDAASAAGRAQALAINFGRGRVVVLGEAAMLGATRDEQGRPIGMNRPGYDNRQFALNIMHWLSRLI